MLHKPIAKGYFCEFLISQFHVHSRKSAKISENKNLTKIYVYTIVETDIFVRFLLKTFKYVWPAGYD